MVSRKSGAITPFLVMDVLERAQEMERAGRHVIHLEVGEPDFDTPGVVKEAAVRALKEGKTHYTHSMGLLELREAISKRYWDWYRVPVSPDCILITAGSSPGIQLVFSALLEEGDEVVLSDPGYACYFNMIAFQGGIPLTVEVSEEESFQYYPDAIARKISPRTRGIVINSPANPTGMLLSPERVENIAQLGPMLLSDEIYHGLTYGEKAHSVLEFTDRAFVFNGFSKLYAMTGWRLGYVIVPPNFARTVQKIHQNFFISANAFVQWAGVAALCQAATDVASMVAIYDERRRLMIQGLRELGFGITHEPRGAFYVFANARQLGGDSLRLSMDILERVQVAVAPGIDFGANGEGYLRFCYANSVGRIEEALGRLKRYLEMTLK
ncbi:MAG: pyridoxal phosphate-dependent aminotransferase [Candidatus Binatia bacterium]